MIMRYYKFIPQTWSSLEVNVGVGAVGVTYTDGPVPPSLCSSRC